MPHLPSLWGEEGDKREAVLRVLRSGELLNFSFLYILIDKVPKDKVLTGGWEEVGHGGAKWNCKG